MWLSYTDSEVCKFHPVCEKALNAALAKLSMDSDYEVLHHKYTGSLEMDFVIRNKTTERSFCVVEVKKTLHDVNSARYQYQAMSYVQMSAPISEKYYYIITNLEYSLAFLYDSGRPRVVQQMLKPGLIHVGDFKDYTQTEFEEKLADVYSGLINNFAKGCTEYLITLEQFDMHMRSIINNSGKWRSSLVIMLYEYIRGAFMAVGRDRELCDIRRFRNNVERICNEAVRVNFKEIFTFSPNSHVKTMPITNNILENIFELGKQNVSGDSVVEVLHSIISDGLKREGVVSTDLELAHVVAILAKSISGDISNNEYICDPAAGSGSLITSAIDVFNVPPKQIKANDINDRLLELLSLRIGLNYSKTINKNNTAEISAKNITELQPSYFDNVSVIVMNPPFIAGIYCVSKKQELYRKIKEVSGDDAKTNVGQMSMEGAFLETICTQCRPGTVISCILPKSHLMARGKEARTLREYLLSDFGLTLIYLYPDEGLFEGVTKETCIIVGKTKSSPDNIKIISSNDFVANVDLRELEKAAIKDDYKYDDFTCAFPGIEGLSQSREYMFAIVKDGWRQVCQEYKDALSFQNKYIKSSDKLILLSDISEKELNRKRGSLGNTGASDLLMVSEKSPLYDKYSALPAIPALRNAKHDSVFIADGDAICFDVVNINDEVFDNIVDDYLELPFKQGQQQKKAKTNDELKRLLLSTANKITPAKSLLIPRGIRTHGKAYMNLKDMMLSTNFVAITAKTMEEVQIMLSWCNTIFYQLLCEINGKPQKEGMRKMEVSDIEATYFPNINELSQKNKKEIIEGINNITSLELNNPTIRAVDEKWATILFGHEWKDRIDEARRLLDLLVNIRNPIAIDN